MKNPFNSPPPVWLTRTIAVAQILVSVGLVVSLTLSPNGAANRVVTATSPLGNLCSIAVLGLLCAALAHFLSFTQDKGEIFRAWRVWIFREFWFKGRARRYWITDERLGQSLMIYPPRPVYTRPTWRQGLYKILGGCIYCNAVWVGSFFYFTGAAFLAAPLLLVAWGWPLFVGAQFVFIDLLFKLQPYPSK